jgi:hypothetical protein
MYNVKGKGKKGKAQTAQGPPLASYCNLKPVTSKL